MSRMTTYIKSVLAVCLITVGVVSCDVHEWPEPKETVPVYIDLNFVTDMPILLNDSVVASVNSGINTRSVRDHGIMRYIVRAYDISQMSEPCIAERTLTRDLATGYDCGTYLDLPTGDYKIMVWSDMTEYSSNTPFYSASNFGDIILSGNTHHGNTDYRDVFRGVSSLSVISDIYQRQVDTVHVTMGRPVAKFELISTDLKDFVDKEILRITAEAMANGDIKGPIPNIDIEDYQARIKYIGYYNYGYNMFTDERTRAKDNVFFQSKPRFINDSTASLGFDYIFANQTPNHVWVCVGMYDGKGKQVSISDQIKIPIRRNHHTIMLGEFLMSDASGGVQIKPGFKDDHNIIF